MDHILLCGCQLWSASGSSLSLWPIGNMFNVKRIILYLLCGARQLMRCFRDDLMGWPHVRPRSCLVFMVLPHSGVWNFTSVLIAAVLCLTPHTLSFLRMVLYLRRDASFDSKFVDFQKWHSSFQKEITNLLSVFILFNCWMNVSSSVFAFNTIVLEAACLWFFSLLSFVTWKSM